MREHRERETTMFFALLKANIDHTVFSNFKNSKKISTTLEETSGIKTEKDVQNYFSGFLFRNHRKSNFARK